MAYDAVLADRIRACLAREKGADEKAMFGGLAFFVGGNLFAGVWKMQLIVRLNADEADVAILEPHVHPFDVTGKPMRGWLLVDPAGVKKDDDLECWLERGRRFAQTLPSKPPKPSKSKRGKVKSRTKPGKRTLSSRSLR